jgi:hypothetical protein
MYRNYVLLKLQMQHKDEILAVQQKGIIRYGGVIVNEKGERVGYEN